MVKMEMWKNLLVNRLPSPIKGLDEDHQKVFIYLRLRKSEDEISRLLNRTSLQTSQIINTIKQRLILSNQLYLIEEPKFIPMQADDADDTPDIPLPRSMSLAVTTSLSFESFSPL